MKQFVLRTRNWLFFTPLTHQFQIQVNYSIDGVDHADTIAQISGEARSLASRQDSLDSSGFQPSFAQVLEAIYEHVRCSMVRASAIGKTNYLNCVESSNLS